jgi:hypothetical protein
MTREQKLHDTLKELYDIFYVNDIYPLFIWKQVKELLSEPPEQSYTREDMEAFAEWVGKSIWTYLGDGKWRITLTKQRKTTSQLLDEWEIHKPQNK